MRNRDTSRHKQFHRGIEQLDEEGVVHVLRRDPVADPTPVLAGVGPLQFEVAVDRLQREFGVTVGLDPTPWTVARRTDAEGADVLRAARPPTSSSAATARTGAVHERLPLERFARRTRT